MVPQRITTRLLATPIAHLSVENRRWQGTCLQSNGVFYSAVGTRHHTDAGHTIGRPLAGSHRNGRPSATGWCGRNTHTPCDGTLYCNAESCDGKVLLQRPEDVAGDLAMWITFTICGALGILSLACCFEPVRTTFAEVIGLVGSCNDCCFGWCEDRFDDVRVLCLRCQPGRLPQQHDKVT